MKFNFCRTKKEKRTLGGKRKKQKTKEKHNAVAERGGRSLGNIKRL